MRRVDKLDRGAMNRLPGVDPTVDAEAVKYVMVEMLQEAGVKGILALHGRRRHRRWPDRQGRCVREQVETPSYPGRAGRRRDRRRRRLCGRGRGIRAHSILHRARLPNRQFGQGRPGQSETSQATSSPGGADADRRRQLGEHARPGRRRVGRGQPDRDGARTTGEQIWKGVEQIRKTPGYEKVYLVETGPQLGVRMSRLLAGVERLTFEDVRDGKTFKNVIGVGGDWRPTKDRIGQWQIPYGVLVPQKIDNVLAAGRCVSGHSRLSDYLRVIPTCFVTGHAAGCAAALAVQDKCRPRDVEVPKLQKVLKEQEAYLGECAFGIGLFSGVPSEQSARKTR